MDKGDYIGTRKSFMEIGEIFCWTATINGWQHLLKEEQFKKVIIFEAVVGLMTDDRSGRE